MSPPGTVSSTGGKIQGAEMPPATVACPKLKCISKRRTCTEYLGWVNMHAYNFSVSGPEFTNFLLINTTGMAVNEICYQFLVRGSAPEIFAVKFQSCRKSCQILNLGGSTTTLVIFCLWTEVQQILNIRLEIWGKAQRESAQRPKSDWKKNSRRVKFPR